MNITLVFETRMCTEETYPHSFKVEFAREMQIDDYKSDDELCDIIFHNALEFENIILTGLHLVDMTTECKGISFIHDAKIEDLEALKRIDIEEIRK